MDKINKLAEKIINQIKTEEIKPTSHWRFVVKDSFFWLAFVLSVMTGGVAVSIILNTLLNNDWDLYLQLSDNLARFVVITLPYFWLIFLGGFILVAYLNIKQTKKAYHHSLKIIIGGVLLISFLLGLTFYNFGLASSLDKRFIQKLPPRFHQMMDSRLEVWQKPQGGFLVGEVQSFDEGNLELKDFEGNFWQVNLKLESEELDFIKSLLKKGEKIRLMGELELEKCEQCFSAVIVRPLNFPQGMNPSQLRGVPRKELQGEMMNIKPFLKIQK